VAKSARELIEVEVRNRAHQCQGQGDGIYMVMIRLDEIIAAFHAVNRARRQKKK
jgi:hypothetical protein